MERTDTNRMELPPGIPGKMDILQAAERIAPHVHRTPVMKSRAINSRLDGEIYFKCENFQRAGAFKFRGACNAVLSLADDEAERGVVTHSSGNHAQALALAASIRGISAYIVMPENAPRVKVEAVKEYGGRITFCRPTLAAREETAGRIIDETGACFIHPYNDPRVIAGQATCGREVLEDYPRLDILMAPVGGGGLLSGTALAAVFWSAETAVIAAEPAGADDACRSFYSGTIIPSEKPNTLADGLLTSLGSLTFPVIRQYVQDIVTCSEASIVDAMRLIWERLKIIVEPSGAVPLACLLEGKPKLSGRKAGIILSGGNIDLDNLPWQGSRGSWSRRPR